MNTLRVLIVENEPSRPRALLDRLDRKVFNPDVRTNAADALARAMEEKFDVFFVDLQLTKEDDEKEPVFEGILLGEKLRAIAPNAAIAMYSGYMESGAEGKFPHYRECIDAGADAVLAKGQLFSITAKQLENLIKEWIQKRRTLTPRLQVQYDTGLRTVAAVEVFGSDTLERILAHAAPGMKVFEVSALQAGYSGAAILRIRAAQAPDYVGEARLVIKISRSRFALLDELKRRPMPGSQLDSAAVLPHGQEVIECDGFFAIPIREVRDMVLLRDFLNGTGRLTKADQKILGRVVRELLLEPARQAKQWETFDVPVDAYRVRATAASEIVDFLNGAASWSSVLKARHFRAIKAAKHFIQRLTNGVWSFAGTGRLAAILHGDFHCRNVFVAQEEKPILIDFGRAEVYPRLFDFAALDVDIVLSVENSADGADQEFGNVDSWFEETIRSFPYANGRTEPAPKSKVSALRAKLIAEVRSLPSVAEAEYAETLIFQFLRYLRFPSITPPKKILACLLIEYLTKKIGLDTVS